MADTDLTSQQEARDAVEAAHGPFRCSRHSIKTRSIRSAKQWQEPLFASRCALGQLAHDETGYGIAEDKREKNRFAAEDVRNYFRGLKTVGVIKQSESIVEIASPRGVVAAIIPSTNPTSTAIFKIIIAIKSRNTIVLSPHPSAARCIAETARIMREAGVEHGLPGDAIICLGNSTIEGTEALMKHRRTAVILATGGIGLHPGGVFFREACFWGRAGKRAGFHRTDGGYRKSGFRYPDKHVFRQRNNLRV